MLLRLLALFLVLANGVYYAWSQNALRAWGLERPTQNEPQRLAHQLRPQALQLLGADEARALAAAALVLVHGPHIGHRGASVQCGGWKPPAKTAPPAPPSQPWRAGEGARGVRRSPRRRRRQIPA